MKQNKFSGKLKKGAKNIAIILAAGHGKRIKSNTPKVIHTVWGVPSILRVSRAVSSGLKSSSQVIVVGIKASMVIDIVGKEKNVVFVHQKEQKGTGHALQVAMETVKKIPPGRMKIFTFPGDMGLLDSGTVRDFESAFEKSDADMMILPGNYEGTAEQNYYGRVIRVPEGRFCGEVIEILQHRNILDMDPELPRIVHYKGGRFEFTKKELLETREFDSGIFAFRGSALVKYVTKLKPDNVQGEIYLTDLVRIFIQAGLTVRAAESANSDVLLGFNNKSTLEKMESIARRNYYEILKDIISIEDDEKFFISEEVIGNILRMDKTRGPLDIEIGDGCYVSSGVSVNCGVSIGRGAVLDGNIKLGRNVKIGDGTRLLTFPDQTMKIGDGVEILEGNLIKGGVTIGNNVRIETGVHITGSYDYPTKIGDGCLIKGSTYIFGCTIEKDNWILHSVLTRKYVKKVMKKDGKIQQVKYILPLPEGTDSIKPL